MSERKFCRVLIPGALSTVQDLGRFGYQRFGIGTSGVMDEEAARAANYLVGNEPGAAVLEMTVAGAKLEFFTDGQIALAGADMGAALNGEPVLRGRTVDISAGDVLQLGFARSGCRAYLAFGGGIAVPPVMNSRSTNLRCGLGGYEGRALRAGDELAVYEAPAVAVRECALPVYEPEILLGFVPGPQDDMFSAGALRLFCEAEYTVSPQSDRMGCRLEGPALEAPGGTDIVSDGIAFGAIQVTNAGLPIVLLADRQTTGGYAKIGTVVSADLPKLAQAMPGTRVRFARVDGGDME